MARGYDQRLTTAQPSTWTITPWRIMKALLFLSFWLTLGTYFSMHFPGRRLEDPKYDLLVVEKTDPSELAFFRKKTVPEFIDPAQVQLDKLVKLRKASEKGTVVPESSVRQMKEIGSNLLEIMNGAKLRQIPQGT